MTAIRRAAILKLAGAAYEIGLDVARGRLQRDEDGRWKVQEKDLLEWLERHEGEDVVFVLGSLADERPVATRTCSTCGRDFADLECPYCRASRIRLRGHA